MISSIEFTVLLILFAGLIFVLGSYEKEILSPPFLFTLMWAFIIVFSVISGGGYYFSFSALLFLFGLIAAFNFGWIFRKTQKNIKLKSIVESQPLDRFHYINICGSLACWISIILLINQYSPTIFSSLDRNSLSSLSATLSVERYEGKRLSSVIMLCISINYLSCFTGGMVAALSKNIWQRLFSISVILPLLIFSVIYTSRSVLLYGIVMFVSSWFLSQSFIGTEKKFQVQFKWIFIAISGALGLFLLFIVSQGLRMGINEISLSTFDRLFSYLRVWFAGNISSFCMWYDQPNVSPLYSYGSYTFAGISEIAGFGMRVPGMYTNSYDVSGKLEVTNIYTIFRFLIDDFGWIGAFVFCIILGLICKYFYNKLLQGSFIGLSILAGLFSGLIFSPIASIWAYNSILFAWICFVGVCILPYFENEFID